MKFSVCVDSVMGDKSTAEAMKIVKFCGIDAVEFWGWWDKDIDAIYRAKCDLNLEIAAFCTKFISLTDSAKREEYKAGLSETIKVAQKLGCRRIISQVGNANDTPREEQRQNIIEGLKQCSSMLENAGVTLVIEPLNTRFDHVGYYLWSSNEGAFIIDAVGSPFAKLLFDCYHQQIMEGDITRRSTDILDKIGHFHAAGNPGRHELDMGEVNYSYVFKTLADKGYDGYIGLEYFPLLDAAEGLKKWGAYWNRIMFEKTQGAFS